MINKKRKVQSQQSVLTRQNASRNLTRLARQNKNSTAEKILKRQKAMRDLNLAQATLRRARANAIADTAEAKASSTKQDTPRLAELKRQKAVRSLPGLKTQKSKTDQKPKIDIVTGRLLFPVTDDKGKTSYLPIESEATPHEQKRGLFISDSTIQKDALSTLLANGKEKPRYDLGKGRMVFPVKTQDGKVIYLPSESSADASEKMRGLYIPDEIINQYERTRRRTATANDNPDQELHRAERASKAAI